MQFNFAKPALGVVYHTTMSRPDAALALAMLYGFEGKREARVGAIALTNSSLATATFCDAVTRFYIGSGTFINSNRYLPVGLDLDALPKADTPMVRAVLDRRDDKGQPQHSSGVNRIGDTSEVMAVMRNALTAQNDGNAAIVSSAPAGKLVGMLNLLGVRDLVKAKVRTLVLSGDAADVAASRKLLAEWPAPIVLCGPEVGRALKLPWAALETAFAGSPAHPIADAVRGQDVQAQDLAAIFHAVHPDSPFFQLSDPGTIEYGEEGRARFVPGGGPHRRISVDAAQTDKIVQSLIGIVAAKPVPRPNFRRPQNADAAADAKKATEVKPAETPKKENP